MKPLFCSVLTSFLAFALLGCGGAQQAAAPAAAPTEAAAPPKEGEMAKPPAETKLGPTVTADGVVFNFAPGNKPNKLYLAGNFNNWNPSDPAFLMNDPDGDGVYTITIKLKPGDYQYKFVKDGAWIKDPDAPGSMPDGFGGQNGKLVVK